MIFKKLIELKALFFLFRFDVLVPTRFLMFLAHMSRLSKWIAKYKKTCDHDFFTPSRQYGKRTEMFQRIIDEEDLDSEIDYLEFGVSTGNSFKWWINEIKHEDARFYGFDTFSGLPEAWGYFKAGDMNNGNEPPKINDSRHTFYQGLFQQTLLPFLSNYEPKKRKVIHMDADIYSATLYVLTLITPYLNKGDIIFFDEFNVPMHEFKAFTEWVESFYIDYEVLGAVNNFYQVAVKLK